MGEYSELEDLELIRKVKNGDKNAFGVMVRRYEYVVAGTVKGMLGNGEDAEDVGQNVFIRFYNSINNFRGDSSLSTYLTRIAINLSLNELKQRKRKNLYIYQPIDKEHEIEIVDKNQNEEKGDIKEIVDHALQKLEPKFRSVVVLRMLQGYSTKETAKILKLPLGTVLSRLSRAQEKLKVLLKNLID